MALRVPAFIYRHQVLRLRHERRIRRGRPPARCLVRRIGLRSSNNSAHVRHRRRHDSVPGTRDPPALLRPHEQRIHAGKYKEADDCSLQSSCWPSPAACRGLARIRNPLRHYHPALARPTAFLYSNNLLCGFSPGRTHDERGRTAEAALVCALCARTLSSRGALP